MLLYHVIERFLTAGYEHELNVKKMSFKVVIMNKCDRSMTAAVVDIVSSLTIETAKN